MRGILNWRTLLLLVVTAWGALLLCAWTCIPDDAIKIRVVPTKSTFSFGEVIEADVCISSDSIFPIQTALVVDCVSLDPEGGSLSYMSTRRPERALKRWVSRKKPIRDRVQFPRVRDFHSRLHGADRMRVRLSVVYISDLSGGFFSRAWAGTLANDPVWVFVEAP